MTPEEIVDLIARMSDPRGSSSPYDSDKTLVRLILEARRSRRPGMRRREARMYRHENLAYTGAMLRVQDAPAEELRLFVMEIIDLLWGVGSAGSRYDARRFDFDSAWAVDTIEEVARAVSRRSFYPFRGRLA